MLTLPELCGSRASAATIVTNMSNDLHPIVSLTGTISTAQSIIDEFCKNLINRRIDEVTFVNASERFQHYFLLAHRLRDAKFLVNFREEANDN